MGELSTRGEIGKEADSSQWWALEDCELVWGGRSVGVGRRRGAGQRRPLRRDCVPLRRVGRARRLCHIRYPSGPWSVPRVDCFGLGGPAPATVLPVIPGATC